MPYHLNADTFVAAHPDWLTPGPWHGTSAKWLAAAAAASFRLSTDSMLSVVQHDFCTIVQHGFEHWAGCFDLVVCPRGGFTLPGDLALLVQQC